MDVQGLETEAESAIAGAATLSELDDARVRYLGRKSGSSRPCARCATGDGMT